MKKLIIALVLFTAAAGAKAQTIAAADAVKHIGETVTICDKVYGGKYLDQAGITFLDMGAAHPKEPLTVVIKGGDRKKFKGSPEELYKDKKVCVTGKVENYKGKAEIIITEPSQIKSAE